MTQDKPTIEDVLKKMFDENSNWYTDEPDKPYVQAMTFDEFKKVAASLNRQGWTRVEDELPENSDGGNQMINVITYNNATGSHEGMFNPVLKKFLTLGWWEIEVTHWMRLPSKPENI